jgi:signal transduction histidine kinase
VFEYDKVPPLSETVATAAYRITQEAITNVARHAFASRVEVVLKVRNGILTLAIADNGLGFNALVLSDSEGLGVAGMRERAALVNGTLKVTSQPEKGTRVSFEVSLDDQRQTDVSNLKPKL